MTIFVDEMAITRYGERWRMADRRQSSDDRPLSAFHRCGDDALNMAYVSGASIVDGDRQAGEA